jgi:hypothetical protein
MSPLRALAVVLLLAAVAGWAGVVAPAHRERDLSRSGFAAARQERERLRSEVARLEHHPGAAHAGPPQDAAEASQRLRRSLLEATEGLRVGGVQLTASGGEKRGGTRGSLVAEGRLADLLRLADRLLEAMRVEQVELSEHDEDGRPARIQIQGRGAGEGA